MAKTAIAKKASQDQETQPERDEALIRERLEIYRAIITGNLAEGFTQMPDQVREDPTLSRAAKLVYEQLLRYTRQKAFCWPSQQRIADDIVTISRRTVIRAINELYERGYIEKWRRGLNRTNIYYINPLFFPGSFKRSWRGRGVLLDAGGPEIRASVDDAPQTDILIGLSGKCQNDTSSNANLAHQGAPNWHTKHTESNETKTETDSMESKIRRGFAAPEKGTGLPNPVPTYSHIAQETIRNEKSIQNTNTHKTSNIEQQSNGVEQIEASNQSKAEETGRPARAKDVEEDKTSKKPRTFEEMAALVGIAPKALEDMLIWLKKCPRPEVTPLKLQGVIPMWSRELGNAEPQLIAANVTQASKLYKYARTNGLSQEAAESCFEHAREAVRNHPEVVKKMAFFFTSLKLDILVALKQNQDLPATRSLIAPSIPDGYDEESPVDEKVGDLPAEGASAEDEDMGVDSMPAATAQVPVIHQDPEVVMISTDDPQAGWPSYEGANNRGEHLLDELDPFRTIYTWVVRQTPFGRWGFEVVRRKGRIVEAVCLSNMDIGRARQQLPHGGSVYQS